MMEDEAVKLEVIWRPEVADAVSEYGSLPFYLIANIVTTSFVPRTRVPTDLHSPIEFIFSIFQAGL